MLGFDDGYPDDSYSNDSGEWQPDDWGNDPDDEVEELSCPNCGASVYEETQQCPHCGDWITPLAAAARRPIWIRVVGGVVVFCFLYMLLAGIVRTFW